ncbi:MAG: DNA primase DnaG [Candidatus Heimdallarchaeota archaeon LC_3]|nr:MAG: DNA primase DnaG [Candidatus Heimdallarchaeota archaeon LC_3]
MENDDSSIELSTVKYLIHIKFVIAGTAEKSDIIGAIFGQTEGLLGDSMDLRELQKTSRIGRILVKLQYNKQQRKTVGIVVIPSSLDRIETSILAASLETVDRVGPCLAKIQLQKIEDVRSTKRNQIITRATQILQSWETSVAPDSQNLVEEVIKQARISAISKWGPENLPAGPGVNDSDTVILLEGRADVLNLLKYGFRNSVAVEGTNVPKSIIPLTHRKRTLVFLDGDRGGDLILKELIELTEIDFVARAPQGREVEELSGKEVLKALRNKIPIEQVLRDLEITVTEKSKGKEKDKGRKIRDKSKPKEEEILVGDIDDGSIAKEFADNTDVDIIEVGSDDSLENKSVSELPPEISKLTEALGSFEAIFVTGKNEIAKKTAVKDLRGELSSIKPDDKQKIVGIVFDGIVTQRLIDLSNEKGLEYVAGARVAEMVKVHDSLKIYEFAK